MWPRLQQAMTGSRPRSVRSEKATRDLTILTFNIWGAGLHEGKSLSETIAVLRATKADIIGLQEVTRHGHHEIDESGLESGLSLAQEIAQELGYFCHEQPCGADDHGINAILSLHPIKSTTHSQLGVILEIDGHELVVFNLHLEAAPYQPYQLTGIAYDGSPFLHTEAEAIAAATATRGSVLDALERELAEANDTPVVIMGDFNEPSFRDWSTRALAIGRHPLAVQWPATRRIEALGFRDAYRSIFPDEVMHPGHTWAVLPGEPEHHDRIDFIFMRGAGLSVVSASVVGEKTPEADLVVTPWPSDHRAVLAVARFKGTSV
jgi:exodeoxyribonuclease III